MEIKTSLGTLYAVESQGENYPGIWLGLERDGTRCEFVLLEVKEANEPYNPVASLNVRAWPLTKQALYGGPDYETCAFETEVEHIFKED